MNRKKVLVVHGLSDAGLALLRSRDDVDVEIVPHGPPESLHPNLARVHAVTLRGTPFREADIAKAPELRVVARFGVGYDAVEVPALTRRRIPLMIAGTANSVSVAEHAMGMMLALAKLAQRYDKGVRAGDWDVRYREAPADLFEKTLLIVGFGRIGTRIARRALAFEMNVLVYDPYVSPETIGAAGCTAVSDLHAALPEADFVTIHCPRSPETEGLFGAAELAAMKPSAFLVNTARGGIVDEAALADALRRGVIRAAGLDVLDREPPAADNPLFGLDNVLLSPHMAGVSREAAERMGLATAQNVLDVFDGRPNPDNVVNKEVLG